MTHERGHPSEEEVIIQCLSAALDGPFFPMGEFFTITGVRLNEVSEVASSWPAYDLEDEFKYVRTIDAVLRAFVDYPTGLNVDEVWPRYFGFHPRRVRPVADRWARRLRELESQAGLGNE